MSGFHTFLCVLTVAVGNVDLAIPVYRTDLTFATRVEAVSDEILDPDAPAFELLPTYVKSGTLPLTWLVASFFAVSAIAHLGNATLWYAYYNRNMAICRVPSRFAEYFVSASIMILILAYQTGVREYMLLLCITALVATTMPYGYLTELIALPDSPEGWKRPLWERTAPYWLGNLPQLAAWVAIIVGFYDQDYSTNANVDANTNDNTNDNASPPWFVYLILWLELFLFFSFGAVQIWQQLRPPAEYYKGEIAYQFLSLGAKGLLGGILLSQVLVLSAFEDAFV